MLRLREIAADKEALDESYEAWLASATKAVAMLRSNGVLVRKVPLDVEVAACCAKERRPFNSGGAGRLSRRDSGQAPMKL